MSSKTASHHARQVQAWIAERTDGLSREDLLDLFEKAIQVERSRSLGFFSNVSLTAILERVLHETQKKYPFIAGFEVTSDGVSVGMMRESPAHISTEAFREALGFFLANFLAILSTLTGGALDNELTHELLRIRSDRKAS